MSNTYFDASYRIEEFGCILYEKGKFMSSKKPFTLEIYKDDLAITPYMLKRFVTLLNKWGFPATLTKQNDYFSVAFHPKDYTGSNHFCAAFTMMRYVLKEDVVGYDFLTEQVIPTMFNLKKKYKNLDAWQCFQLAQYKVMPGYHDQNHSCFKVVSKLTSLKDMQIKIAINSDVNSLFFKEVVPGYTKSPYFSIREKGWKDMHNLINQNEEEALKLLL